MIDGLAGSGKTTQSKILCDDLIAQGKNARIISSSTSVGASSDLVRMYLSGQFGSSPDDVNAYAAATFFSVDRYASYMRVWKKFYEQPDAVTISTLYTTSNAVHQLAKLQREEWDGYLTWLYDFEFNKLGVPRPDLVIYLEMKPEISFELVRQRAQATGRTLDIHETSLEYFQRCNKAALYAADKLGWKRICCYEGKNPLPEDEIESRIAEQAVMLLDISN